MPSDKGPKAEERWARVLGNLSDVRDRLAECAAIAARGRRAFFGDDFVLRYAAHSALIQAGNAIKDLPPAFLHDHPEVEWSALARMRDKIGHGSGDGIDFQLVWATITRDVPQDAAAVAAILRELGAAPGR